MKKRSRQTLEEKLLNLEQELKVSVAPYHHQNFTLTYDLEMPSQTKMAGEFLNVLGKYCSKTKSENLLNLMRQKKQLSVSEVLRAISFNGRVPYYSANDDFENFHNFITRYLIESGWLIDFPKIILRVQGIAMLRLSIFKYILKNWNWIIAIYDFRVLEELAIHYGQVSLKNSAIEEDALRREFIRKVLKQEIAELEQKLEENILKILDSSERNDFFIKNKLTTKNGRIANKSNCRKAKNITRK